MYGIFLFGITGSDFDTVALFHRNTIRCARSQQFVVMPHFEQRFLSKNGKHQFGFYIGNKGNLVFPVRQFHRRLSGRAHQLHFRCIVDLDRTMCRTRLLFTARFDIIGLIPIRIVMDITEFHLYDPFVEIRRSVERFHRFQEITVTCFDPDSRTRRYGKGIESFRNIGFQLFIYRKGYSCRIIDRNSELDTVRRYNRKTCCP